MSSILQGQRACHIHTGKTGVVAAILPAGGNNVTVVLWGDDGVLSTADAEHVRVHHGGELLKPVERAIEASVQLGPPVAEKWALFTDLNEQESVRLYGMDATLVVDSVFNPEASRPAHSFKAAISGVGIPSLVKAELRDSLGAGTPVHLRVGTTVVFGIRRDGLHVELVEGALHVQGTCAVVIEGRK